MGSDALKKQLKHTLKPIYLSAKSKVVRTMYSYASEDLAAELKKFGLTSGDTLMMHSGFNQFNGFSGSPEDVIDILLDILGPTGNLLMMSMAYGGSSQRYAEAQKVFDVAKSPSALGLISETFRRRENVVRSANPLHPILAAGPLAKWLTMDHEKITHSCGRRSPFARLLNVDGKFLFFDAIFRSLTFVHYLEDLHRERLPVSLYDPQPVNLDVKLNDGKTITAKQFLFSTQARERRNFETIENAMRDSGRLLSAKIGNTDLLFCGANDVKKTTDELMQSGEGFYA